MKQKTVTVLGATGSVGKNALDVLRAHPEAFRVAALAAGSDVEALCAQIHEFSPKAVYLRDEPLEGGRARSLRDACGVQTKIFTGPEGLAALVNDVDADVVLVATTGTASLEAVLEVIRNGRTVALANKEVLVSAGGLVMAALAENPAARLVPVDSEHSAIFQCLEGRLSLSDWQAGVGRQSLLDSVSRLLLTGTGGPLRAVPAERFAGLSVQEVINHPKWKMGPKISVDSATLMNKGLEVIEASVLFGVPVERIEVLIHPEAIVHSMVEYVDGSVLAQLGVTDMKLPILYALSYPGRLAAPSMRLDFTRPMDLRFEPPDSRKFPCLGLAVSAARRAGTAPCVLSAADEIAVEAFLEGRIPFIGIPDVIEGVLSRHRHIEQPGLPEIRSTQLWAVEEARKRCQAF